jgi:hypothetical protein
MDGGLLLALPDLGSSRWKNYEGGLYPGGQNVLPADHLAAGRAAAAAIRPLDLDGNPSPSGKIVMISVGMSNTTQEFCAMNGIEDTQPAACRAWSFSGRARDDAAVNHSTLVVVNGARGGMSIENWVTPRTPQALPASTVCTAGNFHQPGNATLYPNTAAGNAEKAGVFGANLVFDEEYDRIAACNLKANGLSFRQVQVAWVKLSRADNAANMLPDTNADAYNLKRDLGNVMRTLKTRFPNLKQVYLSSRVWGGYTGSTITEPYAFETGLAVKWLIAAQINQMRNGGVSVESSTAPGFSGDLNYSTGVAPWLAWGPYLWANGNNPTSASATWFGNVSGALYTGTVASETTSTFTQTLTLPPANAGAYVLGCGGTPRTVTPGPQDPQTQSRWCDSDFFTLFTNGQRATSGTTAMYGWASDGQQEDGTHPTHDGEAKVGTALLHFFKSSPTTACWFLAGQTCP